MRGHEYSDEPPPTNLNHPAVELIEGDFIAVDRLTVYLNASLFDQPPAV